jgi:hypothetical protein
MITCQKNNFNLTSYLVLFACSLLPTWAWSQAPNDPVPTRKADKWVYSGIAGEFDEAHAFHPIIQTKTVKTIVKGKNLSWASKPKKALKKIQWLCKKLVTSRL